MSSKFGGICKSRRVNSQDDNFWNSCQNSSVDKSFPQKYLASSNKTKIDSHAGDTTVHLLDGIPLRNFVNQTMR